MRHSRVDSAVLMARHMRLLGRRVAAAGDGAEDWHRDRPRAASRPGPRSVAALRSAHGPQGRQLPAERPRPRPRPGGRQHRGMTDHDHQGVSFQLPPGGQFSAAVDSGETPASPQASPPYFCSRVGRATRTDPLPLPRGGTARWTTPGGDRHPQWRVTSSIEPSRICATSPRHC